MHGVYTYKKIGERTDFTHFRLMSASPRRRALLAFLKPETAIVGVDEREIEAFYMARHQSEPFLTRAAKACCEIAIAKAGEVTDDGVLHISADTVVILDDHICNKPADHAEAERMLRAYFGRTHHVVTAVCLKGRGYMEAFYSVAEIRFVDYYPALEAAILAYAKSSSPMDKAGAYGIQELDPRFVAEIRGDVHTIIGLPVAALSDKIFS